MEKLKSEGVCLFCEKSFSNTRMSKHLDTHIKKVENAAGTSFLLKVEEKNSTIPYFLFLWVDGTANLAAIDDFLRGIWLECCGHMSSFEEVVKKIPGFPKGFSFNTSFDDDDEFGIPKKKKLKAIFQAGQTYKYHYDFGSTTELFISVVEQYDSKANKKIVLLSRNEPGELYCDTCKKEPATTLCNVHYWEEDWLFCEKCAVKHAKTCSDFADYSALPVVNSPRMGICAYEGGTIDVERDGVFKAKN